MRVNEHINFLKRRGFLIEDAQQLSLALNLEGYIDFFYLCQKNKNNPDNLYCKLEKLTEIEHLDKKLTKNLSKDVTTIYNFLRPKILDNRRKFHTLLNMILDNSNMPINTIKLLAEYINEHSNDADEISRVLRSLSDENIPTTETELDKFIRDVSHAAYTQYENSFIGDHFDSARTRLMLDYKAMDDKLNYPMVHLIKTVLDGHMKSDDLINRLITSIGTSVTKEQMLKADLVCTQTLLDNNGDIVINSGDYVEVKKLDVFGDSYLSEFFSIYKNSDIPDFALEKDYYNLYNDIIDRLLIEIERSEWGMDILDYISKNFAGIIYEENRFIKSNDIELYWSNSGRPNCVNQRRLSIRYRVKPGKVTSYIYNPSTNRMNSEIIDIIGGGKIGCTPIKKFNESINESEFDWAQQHVENVPDDPEVEALLQVLDAEEVLGHDFKEGHGYYTMKTYELTNGQIWAVDTEYEAERSLKEWYEGLIDDIGPEDMGVDLSYYVTVGDYWVREFCREEADAWAEDVSDDDALADAGLDVEYEELEDEENRINDEIDEFNQFGDWTEEEDEKLSELQDELSSIEDKKDDLISRAKEDAWQRYYDMMEECMSDPIDCLVNERGWFSNAREAIDAMGWDLDTEQMAEDLAQDSDYGQMNGYDGSYEMVEVDGTYYVLFRVD